MMAEANQPDVFKIAAAWFDQFCKADGPAGHGGARAFRAACRRLHSPGEAYTLAQTVALHRALAEADLVTATWPDERVGLIAGILGQVDAENTEAAAVLMGRGAPPAVSPMRFQKLIRADAAELITPLRRALIQINFKCSPGRLGSDLFYWGNDVKARWCLQYYGDTQPPQNTPSPSQETLS